MFYSHLESPIGTLLLVSGEDGLVQINFPTHDPKPDPEWQKDALALKEVAGQLRAYFAGELETFKLELAPRGTSFQQKVWKELLYIPYGETISYGELATRIGNPKASRAVGLANGSNPIPIHSVPSRDRIKRKADWVWRGIADQREAAGVGKEAVETAIAIRRIPLNRKSKLAVIPVPLQPTSP